MRAEETFDSFYLKTRRALVHQTFALTGDLAAAQHAVREAYVEAWHHWRKVKNHADPQEWVRPRAWGLAQRRHSARLWQRTRDLSTDDRAVLDALHKLPVSERRALLMVELAGAPLEVGARELNVTQDQLDQLAKAGSSRFTLGLGTDAADAHARLLALDEAASQVALPRPAGVRREGRSRRRTHTLGAAVAVSFLAVASGAFAYQPADAPSQAEPPAGSTGSAEGPESTENADDTSRTQEPTLPSAEDLLDGRDLRSVDPRVAWRVTATHDNTSGEGINYVCQQERFADPEGLATLVRTVAAPSPSAPRVVQSVEISASEDDATEAYQTVLSWFAGCEGGDLQLRRSFAVEGVADRAALLQLRSWARPQTSYTVEVAQLGQVVTTAAIRTTGDTPAAPFAANTLEQANRKICERVGGGGCGGRRPKVEPTAPPLSTESPGALATVDMPPLAGIRKPWVGTEVTSGARNPAATSCDRANFRTMGAVRPRSRTFLVPGADLPDWFGLTETHGTFRSSKAAGAFMRTVRDRFSSCEDRDLATDVVSAQSLRLGRLDASTWRLQTELSQDREVYFDVGFVRRDDTVAQLTFVPTGPAYFESGAFRDLVVRAGERLGELR